MNDAQYKTDLKAAYNETLASKGTADAALDAFLDAFITATGDYVRSATINYMSGLISGSGPVTGQFEGDLQ
jgi:hypothetical protein